MPSSDEGRYDELLGRLDSQITEEEKNPPQVGIDFTDELKESTPPASPPAEVRT